MAQFKAGQRCKAIFRVRKENHALLIFQSARVCRKIQFGIELLLNQGKLHQGIKQKMNLFPPEQQTTTTK